MTIFLAFAVGSLLGHWLTLPSVAPERCIEVMFSDPDAFDPGAHFEQLSTQANPNYDAIFWINSNLTACLSSKDDDDIWHTYPTSTGPKDFR